MLDATGYIDNEPYTVKEADDGSIAILRRWHGPLDILNWPRRLRFAGGMLSRSAHDRPLPWIFFTAVFGIVMLTVAIQLGTRLPSEDTLEYLPVAVVLVAAAVLAFWRHRHRTDWVFDATRRLVIRRAGRRHKTLSFDELDGVHLWHNRWRDAGKSEETQAECFEVYCKVDGAREVIVWFENRSAAERLARKLQDLVAAP